MAAKVLVTYGTKYGATAEIAEKIGQALRDRGLAVDVTAAKQAGSPADYAAVVIGSGVYMGMWRKEAANYLKRNETALSQRPVWVFSSGPTGEGDAIELVQGWRFPKGLQPVLDRIQPRDTAVFKGSIVPAKMNFWESWIINRVKSGVGDFRDWKAITGWAEGIAAALGKA